MEDFLKDLVDMVEGRLGVIPATILLWTIAVAVFLAAVYYVIHYGQLITEKAAAPITIAFRSRHLIRIGKRAPLSRSAKQIGKRIPLFARIKHVVSPLRPMDYLFAAWVGLWLGLMGWLVQIVDLLGVSNQAIFVTAASVYAAYVTLAGIRLARRTVSRAEAREVLQEKERGLPCPDVRSHSAK